MIEDDKKNPRFLFSTVARLNKNPSSVEPCIPLTLSTDNFLLKVPAIKRHFD